MPDTADAIARDLIADIGWLPAIGYVGRRVWQALRLLFAVVLA